MVYNETNSSYVSMTEIFKSIPGYSPYLISNLGRLSRRGKILSTPPDQVGYARKYLKDIKKNILIHRAIAMAFIPNPLNLKEVNHKDGNKKNNDISNLEWVTRKQNAIHASRFGLMHDQNGEGGSRAILKEIDVKIIREAHALGYRQSALARYFNVTSSNISRICSRINWVNV